VRYKPCAPQGRNRKSTKYSINFRSSRSEAHKSERAVRDSSSTSILCTILNCHRDIWPRTANRVHLWVEIASPRNIPSPFDHHGPRRTKPTVHFVIACKPIDDALLSTAITISGGALQARSTSGSNSALSRIIPSTFDHHVLAPQYISCSLRSLVYLLTAHYSPLPS
jgi:hypothetical protein